MRGWNPCSKAFSSAMRRHPEASIPGESTFVLVVEVRGFEPLASSVRVRTGPPLCRPTFRRSPPTIRGEVRRSDKASSTTVLGPPPSPCMLGPPRFVT
jgi:hypothetical protein